MFQVLVILSVDLNEFIFVSLSMEQKLFGLFFRRTTSVDHSEKSTRHHFVNPVSSFYPVIVGSSSYSCKYCDVLKKKVMVGAHPLALFSFLVCLLNYLRCARGRVARAARHRFQSLEAGPPVITVPRTSNAPSVAFDGG